jgi:predicted AAA+ superfamily ATPase
MGIIDQNELLAVIRGYNPWWRGERQDVPAFHRIAYDTCLSYLEHPTLKRAVLLSGPRRVGKTTILRQIANDLALEEKSSWPPLSVLYLSLDNPFLKLASLPELLRLYHSTIYPEGKPVLLLLDEVQYSRDWDEHLKQMIDHHPEYKILATGSATVVQQEATIDSGVGRWIRVMIPTLSFYEFIRISGSAEADIPEDLLPRHLFESNSTHLADLAVRSRPLLPAFQKYLLVGGFPETAMLSTMLAQRLLREDVVDRVLKRDMSALFGVRNIDDLERLFLYLCIHTGGIFKVKTAADALEVSPTTVSNHLGVLERTGLIYRLPPIRAGGKKVLKARHKIYLADAALRNAVLLRGEDILTRSDELGMIVETVVVRHLISYHYADNPRIGYWRDSSTDKEVDIVIDSPSYRIAVEVKYRGEASIPKKAGIRAYCEREDVSYAYWVTQRDTDFGVQSCGGSGTQILKIPAHVFIYLLGQAERNLARL